MVALDQRAPPMALRRRATGLGAHHLVSPVGSGTASNPWHASDAHPAAGHGESAAMGWIAVEGAAAKPTIATAPTSAAKTAVATNFFSIANLLPFAEPDNFQAIIGPRFSSC